MKITEVIQTGFTDDTRNDLKEMANSYAKHKSEEGYRAIVVEDEKGFYVESTIQLDV